MRDTSLDEFLPDDSEPVEEADETGGDDAVEPVVATASWSPDGAACDACGTVVERRWGSDDGQVCSDCKEW